MNEFVFFIQTICVVGFSFLALNFGSAALATWITVQALIANLFVLKQVTLFGFQVTASDTFAIGSLMGLNLLQEYYGREEAKKASILCFFFLLFFAIVSQLHLFYQPNEADFSQASFQTILSLAPRLFFASVGTFFIVQRIDIAIFAFFQNKWSNRSFAFRSAFCLTISQFLDTLLFSISGLYGIVNSLFDLIFMSFFIKLIAIFSFTSVIKWVKQ